jgi:hypothetical protein
MGKSSCEKRVPFYSAAIWLNQSFEGNHLNISETDQMIFNSCLFMDSGNFLLLIHIALWCSVYFFAWHIRDRQ